MILQISTVALLIGIILIVYGRSVGRDGVMGAGMIIAVLTIWLGFFLIGTSAPVTTQVTKIFPGQIEILRSPTAVHVRTIDGQLSRTYTELVDYNAITDTTTFYQVEQFNSYGSLVKQHIKY